MQLYGQMSREELLKEIERLRREESRAQREGITGKLDVLRQQIRFAKSYLTDPATIQPGRWYRVEEEPERFRVEYLNGVMAWGRREGQKELSAVPIGMLIPEDSS